MNFMIKRPDGRSLRAIIVEMVGPLPPDSIITYKQLGEALGLDPTRERLRIQNAVNQAQSSLSKLYQRCVEAVPRQGYRLLRADEHRSLAVAKQSKAERQLKKGLRVLRHARLEEMSAEGRQLHQQQEMIMTATMSAFKYHEDRLNRIEALLKGTMTIDPE